MLLIENSKEKVQDAIFYSYTHNINGFAAYLEEQVALKISGSISLLTPFPSPVFFRSLYGFIPTLVFVPVVEYPGVVSVFPNRGYKLHTTRSWEFLGLERDGRVPKQSLWRKARFGEDTIIANLDSGITIRF